MDGNGAYLHVKNWTRFQHYKNRSPAWIKLYRDLLHDYRFRKLPDPTKLDLILIWLLAANHEGMVPSDRAYLKSVLGLRRVPDTQTLIKQGFLTENASNMLSQRREEEKREERATSKAVDKSSVKTASNSLRDRPAYLYKQPTDLT